jgi:hypothetical protein
MTSQGNRAPQGKPDQSGKDPANPAGAPEGQGNTSNENWQQGNTDTNRPASRPNRHDDDEDSGLGNRTGLR